MMKSLATPALLAFVALAACEPTVPQTEVVTSADPNDTCGLRAHYDLLGQPASAFPPETLPANARVVPFGGAPATDVDASRLNIELDRSGNAASLRCG